jgi:hypothetical protein
MKINQKFNTLTLKEYFYVIENHKKYNNFNTLGFYRSIIENNKLTLNEKILVRDYGHQFFRKTFDFLQLKDPKTFFDLEYLGKTLTKGDEQQIWEDIRKNQQKILESKKIKHRNFGEYAKHNCGEANCPFNGMMIKQGSWLAENNLHFASDKNKYNAKIKSERNKTNRKREQQIIKDEIVLLSE